MKYITVNVFTKPFDDYKLSLDAIERDKDKVLHLWKSKQFRKDYIHSIAVIKTQYREKTSTVCRYLRCKNDNCNYRERYTFDFNNGTKTVEASSKNQCLCSIERQTKCETYAEIKAYRPTFIQDKLLSANTNSATFVIPSKKK